MAGRRPRPAYGRFAPPSEQHHRNQHGDGDSEQRDRELID
jgi:hypothetical protein